MCLNRIFTDEEMEEWLADKPEVIEVWKVVTPYSSGYAGWSFSSPLYINKAGLNHAEKSLVTIRGNGQYWSGFHFFVKPENAGFYAKTNVMGYKFIKCLIKKQWVTAIGTEYWPTGKLYEDEGVIILIAEKAIYPHYPETEARLEDLPVEEPICETVEVNFTEIQ